jgi:hypothetical protein
MTSRTVPPVLQIFHKPGSDGKPRFLHHGAEGRDHMRHLTLFAGFVYFLLTDRFLPGQIQAVR